MGVYGTPIQTTAAVWEAGFSLGVHGKLASDVVVWPQYSPFNLSEILAILQDHVFVIEHDSPYGPLLGIAACK